MKKINLADKAELIFDNEKFVDLYDRYVKNAVKDPISVRKKLEMRDVWYKSSDPGRELASIEGGVEFDVRLDTLVCALCGAALVIKIAGSVKKRARRLAFLRENEREAFRRKRMSQENNA